MVDLVRDPRWGRVMESVGGEDPYLGETFAKIMIEAYQSAIENGAEMIMTSFNTINGIPASVNQWLLRDLLRKELGFKGIVISDYSAIEETITHGVSKDKKEAAYKVIMAGVDIDMMSNVYSNHLKELVEEGKVPEAVLDESVLRVLTLKNKLGLFENPYGNTNEEREKKILKCKEHLQKARKLTAETFVLLKNEKKVLPLKKDSKIALIGPYADNVAILGSWSIYSDKARIPTLKETFEKMVGAENVLYAKGSHILEEKDLNHMLLEDGEPPIHTEDEKEKEKQMLKDAVEIAKKADVIVLAIGEHYRQSGEACSRANIEISQIQQNLLEKLSQLNKKMVTILFNGRPLVLNQVAEKTDALLEVWFPGTEGVNAITDVVFGEVNPSGKLTMSFPQVVGQCPIYYNHYNTGRPHIEDIRFASRYQDIPTESYYPFGYGLSYSNFEYSDLRISNNKMDENSSITVTVKVKNNSDVPGKEVIQLYLQDLVASVVRPTKELKGFKKVCFKPFEEKEIRFEITPEMLKFWNEKMEYKAQTGEFKVFVGTNSRDTMEEVFEYVEANESI